MRTSRIPGNDLWKDFSNQQIVAEFERVILTRLSLLLAANQDLTSFILNWGIHPGTPLPYLLTYLTGSKSKKIKSF